MASLDEYQQKLEQGGFDECLCTLYPPHKLNEQRARYFALLDCFEARFGRGEVRLFSAPGRTELGGNHTDHNHGLCLAASVDLDLIAAVRPTKEPVIRIQSEGFEGMDVVDLTDLTPREEERERSCALIRGIAARMTALGFSVGGFDGYITSQVPQGAGLSSSAAFEILIVAILNGLYNRGNTDPVTAAKISQFAENTYFGKPCGLMDQMACSVGGCISLDFERPQDPLVERVPFQVSSFGHALCIVATGGSHADLTNEYAAVPAEMKAVAAFFGKEALREASLKDVMAQAKEIRRVCGDRAWLRAVHFFTENERVKKEVQALRQGDFEEYKQLVLASGRSSFQWLQNAYSCASPREQGIVVALAATALLLGNEGAYRVHGGGFAGTIQVFVPLAQLDAYQNGIEAVMGKGACHPIWIRPVGGVEVTQENADFH